jgi:hypothetical protein
MARIVGQMFPNLIVAFSPILGQNAWEDGAKIQVFDANRAQQLGSTTMPFWCGDKENHL